MRVGCSPVLGRTGSAALAEGDGGREASRELSTLVFQGHRWHTHPHVVGHQGNDSFDVAAFERSYKALWEFLLAGRVRRGRWLVRNGWFSGQCGSGPLESARGRLISRVENFSDLPDREIEDIAKDQSGALAGGSSCRAVMKASETASRAS
jgi:hypothetical protein